VVPGAASRRTILSLGALCLLGLFSTEITDTDFWWHLRAGQYIVEQRALPAPDPFSYTTYLGEPAYPGEEKVRRFVLTHEWLAQSLWYGVWRAGGFAAVVLFKAALLAAFCGIAGILAARRSGDFFFGVAAAAAAASLARHFALDRPALVTFLLVAVFVWILERGRPLWLLPALSVVWGNSHGGLFLGWVILGAYTAADRRLWRVALVSFAASGLNPNWFRIPEILLAYQKSDLVKTLIEWSRPYLWGPPYEFNVLLYGAGAALLLAWRRVERRDWLLFAAFAAAALTAFRNIILIAFLGPVLIAAYLPWRPRWPKLAAPALAFALAAALAAGTARGKFFQLRAALWKFPSGAADFLLARGVREPMFNSYESGGYLMWRLWPRQKVFIDGRALNESVYQDYLRVMGSTGASAEESRQARRQVLARYGAGVIVTNSFEYTTGVIYPIVLGLADPAETEWQLVHYDAQAAVFMRHPPPGVPALDKAGVADQLEAECRLHVENDPVLPLCARTLGFLFLRAGDPVRARRSLGLYLANRRDADPEAQRAYQQLLPR